MRPYAECSSPASKIKSFFVEFKREKFYPGPGLEPGLLALSANALTIELSRTSTDPDRINLL